MMKFTQEDHERFMKQALKEAQKAYKAQEVPIGAVVVSPEGIIIGRGYNRVELKGCQRFHAEMTAIEAACKKIGDWRLIGCWIYCTIEPCVMCWGFIGLSRLAGIAYGAPSPLFGYGLDKERDHQVYKRDIPVVHGVSQDQAVELLRRFFKQKRVERDAGEQGR